MLKKHIVPIAVILFFVVLVFKDFIFKGLLPIPGDILIGAYFPWLDYKWGYPTGVPVKNPLPSDIISFLYPWRVLGIEIIKSGSLPFWDPTSLLGTPLMANFQAAILNPLNFLFFVFNYPFAWSIQVFLQPILIAFATFLFLKNLGLKTASSLFGSLTFAFSGFSIIWMEYNTIGFTLVFVPLVLLIVDKIITQPKFTYAFWLGLLLCLQIFAGYPQISIYTIFFATIYFIYKILSNQDNLFWRANKPTNIGHELSKQLSAGYLAVLLRSSSFFKITVYISGVISSLLLSAVQIIPSLELLKFSIRSVDSTALAGGIQFLPIRHLITLFIPDFFGNPGTGNYWSLGSYDNFVLFIPIIALCFAVWPFLSKSAFHRQNLIFVIFLLITLLIATNNILSALVVKYDIVGLKSAVAARVLFMFDFSLAVLSAVGLNNLLLGQKVTLFYKIVLVAFYLGITLGLVYTFVHLKYSLPQGISEISQKVPQQNRQILEIVQSISEDVRIGKVNTLVALKNTVIPFLTIVFVMAIVSLSSLKQVVVFLVFAVLVFNITKATDKYLTFFPPKLLYPDTGVEADLKNNLGVHRFDREKSELFPSNTWVPYGLKAASGQNALLLMSTAKYLNIVNGTNLSSFSRYVDVTNVESPLYDTLDIKYLAVLNRHETKSVPDRIGRPFRRFLVPKFKEYKNFGTVRIMENSANLGLAWFSKNSQCINDETKASIILGASEYNPRNLVILKCQGNQQFFDRVVGAVRVELDAPNYTKLQVQTPLTNYLTFSKAQYPGWQAFVDEKRVPLNAANLALTAVLIPEGRHTVELKYHPDSFYTGLKISVMTLLGWVIYLVLAKLGRSIIKFR